jgi:hypothetical protein
VWQAGIDTFAVACGEEGRATRKLPQGDSNEPQKLREKQHFPEQRGTHSGTPLDATRLQALAAESGKATPEDRAQLAALLFGEQGEEKDG